MVGWSYRLCRCPVIYAAVSLSHAIYVTAGFLSVTASGLFHKYVNPLTITISTHEALLPHLVSADGLVDSTYIRILILTHFIVAKIELLCLSVNITCKK